MNENKYLSLSDLIDGDLSSYEYYNGLPAEIRSQLDQHDDITTFSELMARSAMFINQQI